MKNLSNLLVALLLIFSSTSCTQTADESAELRKRAEEIHQDILTIDTHTDTPLRIARDDLDLGEKHDTRESGLHVDFPRMKEGGLDAVFFVAFTAQRERTGENYAKAKSRADQLIELIYDQVNKNSDIAELAYTFIDAYDIKEKGKRAVFIGLENGFPIAKDLTRVKEYYDKGVRYITLSHSANNDICDSSTDPEGPEHGGVSEFGEKVIAEMNRLGMLIDVSHISDSSFYDVIELSRAPVFASHSCVRSLRDHPRNLSDHMIKTLAENGGVLQICLMSDYLKKMEPNPQRDSAFSDMRMRYKNFKGLTDEEMAKARQEWVEIDMKYPPNLAGVSDAVDHIDYVRDLVGIDYVGIGSDFDGGGRLEDCFDASQYINITIELLKRGYTGEEIEKIWGGNMMRVLREAERTAED